MITTKTEQLLQDLSDVVHYDNNSMLAIVTGDKMRESAVKTHGDIVECAAMIASLICIVAGENDMAPHVLAKKIAKILSKNKKEELVKVIEREEE